jgi:hypothetical protein
MADGDYYARNLAPGWRTVARGIDGRQDLDFLIDSTVKAYADTMRRGGGVPGLNSLVEPFIAAARGNRERWEQGTDDALREQRGHYNTHKLIEAGQILLETRGERLCEMSDAQLRQEFAEAGTTKILDHNLMRCWQGQLPEAYSHVRELREVQRSIVERVDVSRLAAETLTHEDGVEFRAPRRQRAAAGTAGVMNRTLV